MPGFTIVGGENDGGQMVRNTVETRRNHRWRWTSLGGGTLGPDVLILLQKCQRPKFVNEEPVMHHNQEQAYFIGKQSWEPMEMTWYDAEQSPDCSKAIWEWLKVGNLLDAADVSLPTTYKKEGLLEMVSGVGGRATETWRILGAWPKEVNYSDNDYTNTDIATITVRMRYDRAVRQQ
jgi:hypothetical protein